MTRRARWAVLGAALLLIALAGCAELPPPGEYRLVPLDGQQITPGSYDMCQGGQCWAVYWGEGVTPSSTPGIVIPTVTPPPTNTPRPTATATPVPASATPTQEITPVATLPPAPIYTCEVKVAQPAINARILPAVDAAKVGTVYQGETIVITQVVTGGEYLWALHDRGWSVIRERSTWWVDGTGDQTESCVDVQGWPGDVVPPPPVVYWEGPPQKYGTHGFTDTNAALYAPFFPHLGGFKLVGGGVDFYALIEANNPGVVTVHRPFGAYCPDYGTPAAAWLAQFETEFVAMRGVVDYLEPTNECGHGYDDAVSHQTQWIIEAVNWANARGLCLALYSFGVGNPADGAWPDAFLPGLQYIYDHPCQVLPDGTRKLHAVAMHAYTEAGTLTGPLGWYWLHGAPDTRYWPALPEHLRVIPLLITEWGDASLFARSVPESSNPVNCALVADSVRWALMTYTGKGYPDAIYHWTAGGFGQWYDAVGQCRAEIAAALAGKDYLPQVDS